MAVAATAAAYTSRLAVHSDCGHLQGKEVCGRMRRMVLCLILAAMLLCPAALAEAGVRVESVEAEVTAGHSLPPLVRDRMNRSVSTIADQLLSGQDVAVVTENCAADEQLIREVFDKVLVGYTVQQVSILPAEHTRVQVQLLPWADVIQAVKVETTVEGMPPQIERLVRQDLAGVDQVFYDALIGLPTAASDWTNGVLKHHLNDYLAVHLPEFRADFELQPDKQASVMLVVYPKLPVVRTVDLSMRSDTIPSFTLLGHRELAQDKVDDLVGVPVSFVQRHQAELEDNIRQELDGLPDFRALHMKTTVDLQAAEQLHLISRSNSSRYRLRLTGWQDIGRRGTVHHDADDNLLFRLHAGRMLSGQDEFFLLLDVMPQQMDWDWQLGLDRRLNSRFHSQLRYDARQKRFVFGGWQQLAPRWQLRYEYRVADHLGEAGLRYKMHDFLSLEYVVDREQSWLRIIGDF